jgi:uncharacterized membrane protein YphA (DoxX/SURF4 family)
MLSIFPSLLSYHEIGPFLLRLTLAVVLLYWSYGQIRARVSGTLLTLGVIDGLVGLLLIAGLFTQIATLIAAIILFVKIIKKIQSGMFLTDGVNYFFILFVISLSLLFMGPGAFSVDYPL